MLMNMGLAMVAGYFVWAFVRAALTALFDNNKERETFVFSAWMIIWALGGVLAPPLS